MASEPLFYLVIAACVATFLVLMFGVIGFSRGSEFNRKHANKIMRLRIAMQFIAVLLILLYIWLRQGG